MIFKKRLFQNVILTNNHWNVANDLKKTKKKLNFAKNYVEAIFKQHEFCMIGSFLS